MSICKASRLEGNHGYIHTPGYPGHFPISTVRCNCSATLSRTSNITVKVSNTFTDGQQTLAIKWDSQTESLIKKYPHFKEYTHSATKTFSLDFSSNIRDTTFWLEYTTDTPIRVHCSDKTNSSPTTTSSTTRPTTTATTTTTTTETTTTSSERTQTPTNADKTSSAAFDTTVSSSPTHGPTARNHKDSFSDSSITALGVFLVVTTILNVILTIILLHRMGIFARFCKGRAGDGKQDDVDQIQLESRPALRLGAPGVYGNEGANYENVCGSGIVNTAFTDIQDSEANGNHATNDNDLYVNVGATAAARLPSCPTKGRAGTYENVGSNFENDAVGVALPNESTYQEVGGGGDGGVVSHVVDPGQRELDSTYASLGTIDRPEHAEYADLRQAHYNRTK